jgi:hypothetical protein
MSFAGNRERGSVNQTYIEPEISYNFESGWYVDCDPPSRTTGQPIPLTSGLFLFLSANESRVSDVLAVCGKSPRLPGEALLAFRGRLSMHHDRCCAHHRGFGF